MRIMRKRGPAGGVLYSTSVLKVSDLRISVPIVLYSFTQEKNIKKDKKIIKLLVFIHQEFIVKVHILFFISGFQKAFQNRDFGLF